MLAYAKNCAVSEGSKYKIGKFGGYDQVYAVECNGTGGIVRNKKGNMVWVKCVKLLMELIQLGKIEKGSLLPDKKV